MKTIIDIQKNKAICNPTQYKDIEKMKKIKQDTVIVDLNEIDDIEIFYNHKSFRSAILGCAIELRSNKNIIIWDSKGFRTISSIIKGESK